jgi:hypothetical protein
MAFMLLRGDSSCGLILCYCRAPIFSVPTPLPRGEQGEVPLKLLRHPRVRRMPTKTFSGHSLCNGVEMIMILTQKLSVFAID